MAEGICGHRPERARNTPRRMVMNGQRPSRSVEKTRRRSSTMWSWATSSPSRGSRRTPTTCTCAMVDVGAGRAGSDRHAARPNVARGRLRVAAALARRAPARRREDQEAARCAARSPTACSAPAPSWTSPRGCIPTSATRSMACEILREKDVAPGHGRQGRCSA